jgi:hypothetical protein
MRRPCPTGGAVNEEALPHWGLCAKKNKIINNYNSNKG